MKTDWAEEIAEEMLTELTVWTTNDVQRVETIAQALRKAKADGMEAGATLSWNEGYSNGIRCGLEQAIKTLSQHQQIFMDDEPEKRTLKLMVKILQKQIDERKPE